MDLPQIMKAGPSTAHAAWNTRTTPRIKPARNFIVAASTVIILVLLYLSLGSRSLEAFTPTWSLLFGAGGRWFQSESLQGDQYLLGVGKADITGYVVILECVHDLLLTFLQPSS